MKKSFDKKVKENIIEGCPIRILHFVAGIGIGGYETFIMNVYRNIDRNKVQFDFFYSFDGAYKEEILSLGGKVFKAPFITEVGPFEYRKSIIDFLNKHPEYKIVHSHMDKFSGLVMEVAKKCEVPVRIAHSHSTKNEGGLLYNVVKNYYGRKINSNANYRFACSTQALKWLYGDEAENNYIIKNGIDLSKFCPGQGEL